MDAIVATPVVVAVNFNGDGNSDLLLRNSNSGKNQIWLTDRTQAAGICQPTSRGHLIV